MQNNLLAQNEGTDFGLDTIQQQRGSNNIDVSSALSEGSFGIAITIMWIFVGLFGLALVLRFFGKRLYNRFNPFEMTTMRILVPKESLEIENRQDNQGAVEAKQMIAPLESFMANLAGLRAERGLIAWFLGRRDHFAFEIVAHEGKISFYVTTPKDLMEYVSQQIQAQYPDSVIEEKHDYNIFSPSAFVSGAVLKFKKSYFFPIKTYAEMDTDPLNALTNSLSKFRNIENGGAAIQYVVRSAHPRWHSPVIIWLGKSGKGKNYQMPLKWFQATWRVMFLNI